MIDGVWRMFLDRVLLLEGSTRGLAIMRIALVMLAWTRFADELLPFRNLDPAQLALSASFFGSTTLMFFGLYSRFATAWTGATLCTMVYLWRFEPWTHHHTTLLALSVALLAFTPCGRSYSVDRWLRVRSAERSGEAAPPETGPLWAMRLIAFNVSVVYLFSAIDKTNLAFLSGERLQAHFAYLYWGSDVPTLPGFEALLMVAAVVVVVLEYVLAFALWVRRWQRWAFPVGFALHAAFYLAIPVGTFSLTMWTLYIAYLDPDALHRAIDRMSGAPVTR